MRLLDIPRRSRRGSLVVLALSAALVAGCGESEEPAGGSSGSGGTASAAESAAAKRLEVLERGLATKPPTSGPKAQTGKNVWAISCGDFVESCSVVTDYTLTAGKAIGWDMTRFDAKVDPAKAADGIRQAIADDADAIIVSAFDCTLVKAALKDAKEADVVTYGSGTTNCDDPIAGDGGEGLYTLTDIVPPGTGPGWANFTINWGEDKGNYAVAETGGKAKAINVTQTDFPNIALISQGFDKAIKSCKGCEVVDTVEYTSAQLSSNALTQNVTNALASNPDANVLHLPVDSLLANVGPAIQESGRSKDLLVVGGEGNFKSNIEQIRKDGTQDAALAFDLNWESWSQVDDINRLFAGEKPVYGGWGYSVVDKDTNLPAPGKVWNSKLDFASAYKKIWGRQ